MINGTRRFRSSGSHDRGRRHRNSSTTSFRTQASVLSYAPGGCKISLRAKKRNNRGSTLANLGCHTAGTAQRFFMNRQRLRHNSPARLPHQSQTLPRLWGFCTTETDLPAPHSKQPAAFIFSPRAPQTSAPCELPKIPPPSRPSIPLFSLRPTHRPQLPLFCLSDTPPTMLPRP